MSLRDRYLTLRTVIAPCNTPPTAPKLLRVARPRDCNNATNDAEDATRHATPAQQPPATPHECLRPSATGYATTAQHGAESHATTVQQTAGAVASPTGKLRDLLRVAGVGFSETQQRNNRLADALAAAINRACDVRGDDDGNRAGLLAECAALPPEGQADMLAHFTVEAARWAEPEPDARVTCITCTHYRPHRCGNHRAAGLQSSDVGRDLATLLQHCPGWKEKL